MLTMYIELMGRYSIDHDKIVLLYYYNILF